MICEHIDRIHGRFCKNLMIPRSIAHKIGDCKLGGESRQGKMLYSMVNFWYRILQLEHEELLKKTVTSGSRKFEMGKLCRKYNR
jgi:hypothetical protein